MIDESGILMGEAIMVLTPHMGTQQVIEGRDLDAPRQPRRHLEPFRMLVEHGIHDMNEGLVAIEETVSAGQQVALEPAFALMFAQDFHHTAGAGEVLIAIYGGGLPLPVRGLEYRFQAVRDRFVRSKNPEIAG